MSTLPWGWRWTRVSSSACYLAESSGWTWVKGYLLAPELMYPSEQPVC